MTFLAHDFFKIEDYAHRALFKSTGPVWESLKAIKAYLAGISLGKIQVEIPAGAFLINPESISIGKGSVVEPGAYIKGPCVIGDRCTIRQGAYIRGELITGNDCVIGHTTEVKHSIFLDGVHAAHFAYIGDSVLGNRVNLGAGTKCANLRLDGKEIVIHYDGQRYLTGLRKFGAILGDGAQTGCNSVTNPGTLFGPKVFCYPCLNIGGVVMTGVVKSPSAPTVFSNSERSL